MFNKSEDFIYHYKSLLSNELCQNIINYFEDSPFKQKGLVYSDKNTIEVNTEAKKSTDLSVSFGNTENIFICNLFEHLCNSLNIYKKRYSFLDEISAWKIDDKFNIRKYNPSEAFKKIHCEHGPEDCSIRIMAWMFYLNTVKNGGETNFKYQNKKFKPNTGDLLIWPAFWTHPHVGLVSKNETKYIATGWIVFS